jgi:hypothetical protein
MTTSSVVDPHWCHQNLGMILVLSLDLGPVLGWKKIRIRYKYRTYLGSFSESLVAIFFIKILRFFAVDRDQGSGAFLIRDLGWKNSDPG